ncbi:MAG: dihydropteroate synthase [Akkermansiaceae bacterium]|nr:dihydropteroate synthase [Akkermansiaceae bacterium]
MNDSPSSPDLDAVARRSAARPLEPFETGGRVFRHHPHTDIMGVINLSTDSFYRETVAFDADAVRRKADLMRAEGAAIADLGLKSSRIAQAPFEADAMRVKLAGALDALRGRDLAIAIDTDDPEFARIALDGGATILNVTTTNERGEFEAFLELRERYDAAIVACYTPGFPRSEAEKRNTLDGIGPALAELAERFRRDGIRRAWLDPGLGFSARLFARHPDRIRAQLRSLFDSCELRSLGFPACQSMPNAFEIFQDHVTSAEVLFGTVGWLGGADLIRTHEPGKMSAVLRTLQTLAEQAPG